MFLLLLFLLLFCFAPGKWEEEFDFGNRPTQTTYRRYTKYCLQKHFKSFQLRVLNWMADWLGRMREKPEEENKQEVKAPRWRVASINSEFYCYFFAMWITEFSAFIYCFSVKSIISINFCGQPPHNDGQWRTHILPTVTAAAATLQGSICLAYRPKEWNISCSPFGKVRPVKHLVSECLLLLLATHRPNHCLHWPNIINYCVQFTVRKNGNTRSHQFTTRIKHIEGKNCHVRYLTGNCGGGAGAGSGCVED